MYGQDTGTEFKVSPLLLKQIVYEVLESFRDNDFVSTAAWFTEDILYISKAVNEQAGDGHGFTKLLGSYVIKGRQEALNSMIAYSRSFRFERYEAINVIVEEDKAATRCSWRVKSLLDGSTTDGESFQWWYFRGNQVEKAETIAFYQRRIGAIR